MAETRWVLLHFLSSCTWFQCVYMSYEGPSATRGLRCAVLSQVSSASFLIILYSILIIYMLFDALMIWKAYIKLFYHIPWVFLFHMGPRFASPVVFSVLICIIDKFDENVCQKPRLGQAGPGPSHEWRLWLGPALEKAKAGSGQAKATAFGPSWAGTSLVIFDCY
jgi:hypothetical protein